MTFITRSSDAVAFAPAAQIDSHRPRRRSATQGSRNIFLISITFVVVTIKQKLYISAHV